MAEPDPAPGLLEGCKPRNGGFRRFNIIGYEAWQTGERNLWLGQTRFQALGGSIKSTEYKVRIHSVEIVFAMDINSDLPRRMTVHWHQ